jgi:hypothetical protein
MANRKFTVTFDVADDEFENFMTRLSGGKIFEGEIPRNLTLNTGEGDEGDGPVNTGSVDKFGVTWDARFHGVAKNTNKDGSWKRTKGLSDAVKAEADAYEAAQKAAFTGNVTGPAVTEPTPAPVAAPVTAAPVAEPAPVAAPVGMPGLPVAAPAALPLPVAPVAKPPISYEEVVALFGQASAKDPSIAANFAQLYAECGISDPNALTTDETLRRKLADRLEAVIAAAIRLSGLEPQSNRPALKSHSKVDRLTP